MKKIFLLILSLVFILTGCSNEQKSKNKSVSISKDNKDHDGKEEKTDNKSEDKASQENSKDSKTSQVKHDYEEAEKLAKERLYLGLGGGMSGYLFFYLNNAYKNEKYKNKYYVTENKLSVAVDKFNEYFPEVYNENQVLESLRKELQKMKGYVEVDYNFETDYLKGFRELKSDEEGHRMGTVYFKKDKIFVTSAGGVGGMSMFKVSPKSMWHEDGENIKIPIIDEAKQNAVVGEMVLAINHKEYTGGEHRSYYYVKSSFK